MEQRNLRAKSWVALDCVSDSVVFVNDKIVGENSIELQLFCKAVSPGFDLLVILVGPVEARSGSLRAGIKADLPFNLYLAS